MTMPTSSPILEDLERRLMEARGADRELDAEIAIAFDLAPSDSFLMSALSDKATFATGAYSTWKAPHWTASVDAALALVERLLPGYDVELYVTKRTGQSICQLDWPTGQITARSAKPVPVGCSTKTPLAILLAMISALRTKPAEMAAIRALRHEAADV